MVLDRKTRQDSRPWVDMDVQPWRMVDGVVELTPRDVWGFVKSHPRFSEVDLKAFYQSFVDRSYCSGFGPVITPSDVENALMMVLVPFFRPCL